MKEKRTSAMTEGRSRTRMNSADLMILLLCIICVAGMVLRFGVIEKIENEATAQTATVTVLIEGISSTNRDYLVLGEDIYFTDSDRKFGSVSSILSVAPSPVYEYSDDGNIEQMNSVNGRVDIRAVLSAKGTMTEAGFLLDGTTYVAPNMTLSLNTAKLSVVATVIDINIVE